ncbi:hypothetical protein [Qipengyuania sp. ASV99]|uniref:hypothetical protein n=1 Tax=Qipengyuania sp. ASV99 TaxID=3399681 RepID=UPI003A4C5085
MLAFIAAGLIGLVYKGVSERFFRIYLEEAGVVVLGEVVGHRLYRCRGIRCSERTVFEGEHGSEAFDDFLRDCRLGRQSNCHTDLIVRFLLGRKAFEFDGQVNRRDFREIGVGGRVAVLASRSHPEKSLLRDHNPEGFLFWLALTLLAFSIFFAGIVISPRQPRRRYARP